MKKISLYFIGMAMMGMAMTSCQKEEWAADTIAVTFEKGGHKTHLAGSQNIDNRWDALNTNTDIDPEEIMVVYPTGAPTGAANDASVATTSVKYTALEVREDMKKAVFGHEENVTVDFTNADIIDGKIEMYYPASSLVGLPTNTVDVSNNGEYSDYTTTNRKIKLNYFQNKNTTYSHDTRDWPMYGYVSRTTDGNCREATLYNLCGGLRLQLKSNDNYAAITKITVYTDDKALTGEFTLQNTPSGYDANPATDGSTHLCAHTYTITGESSANKRRIIYQPANDIVALDATNYTDFDICLPIGTYNNLYIRFEGVDGQYCIKKLNASQQLNIKRDELKVIQFDLHFTPPEGAVFAYYSVSPTKSVYFAKGNLRYTGDNETHDGIWQFADNQWDMLTSVTALKATSTGAFGVTRSWRNGSYTYDGRIRHWRDGDGSVHNGTTWSYSAGNGSRSQQRHTYYDNSTNNVWELFGWSNGANDHYGVSTRYQNDDYYNGGFVDWGTLPITNGGNEPHQWRTLYGGKYTPGRDNYGEWDYLLNHRIDDGKIVYNLPDAYTNNSHYNLSNQTKACWAIVRVDGIPGIMLFPDRFQWSQTGLGVDRIPRYLNENPSNWTDANVINYTQAEMNILFGTQTTSCGCAFLPAAGSRGGASTEQICYLLRYWLNSQPDQISVTITDVGNQTTHTGAYYIGFTEDGNVDRHVVPADSAHNLYWGRAVRLAMDAVPWDTRGTDNPWIEKGGNGSKGVATKAKAILRKRY